MGHTGRAIGKYRMILGGNDGDVARAIAAAFWLSLAGGAMLAVTYFTEVPTGVALVGWAALAAGLLLVVVLAVVDGRRRGSGFGSSLWLGIRTGLRWVLTFMP